MTFLLALDAANAPASIVLVDAGSATAVATSPISDLYWQALPASRRHGEVLLPAIQDLLAQAQLTVADIAAVACGLGPGSFTSIRLVLAVCQTIAWLQEKPVMAFSSLQLLAQAAYQQHQQPMVTVLVNAHMGGYYLGSYQAEQGVMQPLCDDQLLAKTALAPFVTNQVIVAQAAESDLLAPAALQLSITAASHAQALAKLALVNWQQQRFMSPLDLAPSYLRQEDAWKIKV